MASKQGRWYLLRILQTTTHRDLLTEDDTDYTPEDVDDSDAGWSTDFAVVILALCYVTWVEFIQCNTFEIT